MRELASASLKTAQVQPYVYQGIERLSRVERRSVRNNLEKFFTRLLLMWETRP